MRKSPTSIGRSGGRSWKISCLRGSSTRTPICAGGVHAKYITWGRGWEYFAGADVTHCRGNATLVCYEQLRAMKRAADMAELTPTETEAVFYRNTAALFGF